MHVDFPDPEGPTKATFCPSLTAKQKSLSTLYSLRQGYLKFTMSKFTLPLTDGWKKRRLNARTLRPEDERLPTSLRPAVPVESILGFRSMIRKSLKAVLTAAV